MFRINLNFKISHMLSFVMAAGLLSSCSYLIDTSVQAVSVETPGAQSAHCYLIVEGLKYQANPPQTINIKKSKKDMEVVCKAPGNRRLEFTVEPGVEESAYWNVTNGVVPGMAWDFASDSMFKWPDVIVADFTNIQRQPSALPDYNNPDVKQPEEYDLEEYLPGVPRLNSDRYAQPVEIQRRRSSAEYDESFNSAPTEGAAMDSKSAPSVYRAPSSVSEESFVPSDLVVPGSVSTQNPSVQDAITPLYPVE
jgi:hypothetical protein